MRCVIAKGAPLAERILPSLLACRFAAPHNARASIELHCKQGEKLCTRVSSPLKGAMLRGAIDEYFASPVGDDGKVYLISQDGTVSVVRAVGE